MKLQKDLGSFIWFLRLSHSHESETTGGFLLILLLLAHVHLSEHIGVRLLLLLVKSSRHVHSHIRLLLLVEHIHVSWLLESATHGTATLALTLHHASHRLLAHTRLTHVDLTHIGLTHIHLIHLVNLPHRLTHLTHLIHVGLAHLVHLILEHIRIGLGLEATSVHVTSANIHSLLVLLRAPEAV